jgi:hypothetical protein
MFRQTAAQGRLLRGRYGNGVSVKVAMIRVTDDTQTENIVHTYCMRYVYATSLSASVKQRDGDRKNGFETMTWQRKRTIHNTANVHQWTLLYFCGKTRWICRVCSRMQSRGCGSPLLSMVILCRKRDCITTREAKISGVSGVC